MMEQTMSDAAETATPPLLEISGPRATIRLNRPKHMNRLQAEDLVELVRLFDRVEADAAVRVLVLTGTGDVLEPEHGVMAIGSGGNYALAGGHGLARSDKVAEAIVRRALDIPADICVYTNRNVTIETLTA
jgi:enoyl-CoA hydratase/carnithine racemase